MKHHIDKLKEKISEHRKELFFAFLIFLLAFGTRAFLMKYELPFEFDPYWHARMVSYIVQGQPVPAFDPMAYYYNPQQTDFGSPLFWYAAAGLYTIVHPFGPYSKDALILVMNLLPALYGALAAFVVFFLVKEIYGRKPAIAAAILAAVIPAFVYRTMAGFFEPTSSGFFWLVSGLYFLVKATNNTENLKKGIIFAIASGAMLSLMALSWKGFTFTYLFLLPIGFFTLLKILTKSEVKDGLNYAIYYLISIGLMTLTGWLIVQDRIFYSIFDSLSGIAGNIFGGSGNLIVAGFLALTVLLVVFVFAFAKFSKKESKEKVLSYASIALLYLFLIAFLGVVLSGVNLSTTGIGSMVGEESRGFDFFGNKYNALFFLGLLALVLIPLKNYFDDKDRNSNLVFFLALATLALAYIKLKFTFLFGLPLAVSSSVVFWFAFEKLKGNAKKATVLFLGFLLLVGIAAGTFFVSQNVPNIEANDGWKEALKWISTNTPKDAKFFNWWNQGHWITFIGERAVLIDNRNAEGQGRSDSARFFTTDNPDIAIGIIQKYKSDYIIADEGTISSQSGLVPYAIERNKDANEVQNKTFFMFSLDCSKTVAAVSLTETFACGGNNYTKEQMAQFPTIWQSSPNNIINERTPIFIYRAADNSKIFALSPETNNTVIAKMWFKEPTMMKNFEEVYSVKQVKVFKVKKD
ncbi:MAG: STT3 domain-containing protein [Candidatus Diapherotrites archaeon]|nr:STT3 domain-containing protein [Candidatus Diapherotrites archaeon]